MLCLVSRPEEELYNVATVPPAATFSPSERERSTVAPPVAAVTTLSSRTSRPGGLHAHIDRVRVGQDRDHAAAQALDQINAQINQHAHEQNSHDDFVEEIGCFHRACPLSRLKSGGETARKKHGVS